MGPSDLSRLLHSCICSEGNTSRMSSNLVLYRLGRSRFRRACLHSGSLSSPCRHWGWCGDGVAQGSQRRRAFVWHVWARKCLQGHLCHVSRASKFRSGRGKTCVYAYAVYVCVYVCARALYTHINAPKHQKTRTRTLKHRHR